MCRETAQILILIISTQAKDMKTSKSKLYSIKAIESGKYIELYGYELKQVKKLEKSVNEKAVRKIKVKIDELNYVRENRTIIRTKNNLKRLINANIGQYNTKDKFITLTFKEFKSRDEVEYCFKLFNQRLKMKYRGFKYKYIAVIERGTKGTKRLHLHCLFFGLPYIPQSDFEAIWKYGHVDMRAIAKYEDVANYILKYVQKTLYDGSYIGKGKKFYFTSKGLIKPQEYYLTNSEFEKFLENRRLKLVYENEFENPYTGKVRYQKLKKEDIRKES